ncbi:two-component sensor histidine kinase (plasmid) [Caballeronia sp. NK8]|uniref:histidine kinase dimerization/phospho-acceptor domain-containing protein n=1 Tax=Caballeronia sp. NK8 TaxID=140098 RepID=UPI001BB4C1FE|nr:histidine kinase dimerization/phospho-acceptor domain-containing protein [Caballeronia sp. NK8]BCQ29002.1 two-component sensor histidine kinase [Caballeronia sp. NK8]
MRQSQPSIRSRLMWLVLLSVGLSWLAMFAWSFYAARHEVTQWDETRLIQLVPLLARLDAADLQQLAEHGIDACNEIAHDSHSVNYDSDYGDRFVRFHVVHHNWGTIARSSDFPVVDFMAYSRYVVTKVDTESGRWLLYTARDSESRRTICLMEPANEHSDLVSGVAARARPVLLTLPVLMALVWFSIGIGMRPLASISREVQARDGHNLRPIEMSKSPRELHVAVTATNGLLERLRLSLARERTFTADAAHELKTPLAAIKVQAQVAMGSSDASQQRQALECVVMGVDRSAHLVEQLLLLARLDEEAGVKPSRFALREVIFESIAFRRHLANEKSISLRITGDGRADIHSDKVLVRVLVDNLLDNAIKYGKTAGTVDFNCIWVSRLFA